MRFFWHALSAATVTAGMLVLPSAASAAEEASFVALTERDQDGKTIRYPIHQGETVPAVLGVANTGTTSATGVVVQIYVLNDLSLPKEFTNCLYYVDGNLKGAFCEIDAPVAAGKTYALTPFQVTAAPDATDEGTRSIFFEWYDREKVKAEGGIEALAKEASGRNTTPAAGSGGTIGLETKDLPTPPEPSRLGFAYLKLVPPSAPPTTPPTAATSSPTPTTSSPTPGTTQTTAPTDGTGGGDSLPTTGADIATVLGAGAGLLAAGTAGFLITRRRRRRFVA